MWNFSKPSYPDSLHNLLCRFWCDSIQLLYATDIFSLEARMPGHSEGWYIHLSRKMHCLCTLVTRLSRDWEALRMAQGIIEISESLLICLTFSLWTMLDPLWNPFLYNLVFTYFGHAWWKTEGLSLFLSKAGRKQFNLHERLYAQQCSRCSALFAYYHQASEQIPRKTQMPGLFSSHSNYVRPEKVRILILCHKVA